jgi:hypothetical protein
MVIDFRQLNRYVVREQFYSPPVIQVAQRIQSEHANLFTKCDAHKIYHQLELVEASRDLTTFITLFGRFRYMRAPFGINCISEHFNRRMTQTLTRLGMRCARCR